MLMTALRRSTRARLAMRMFGTVRKDLNRAMTARTKPLPNTEAEVRMVVKTHMAALVKSGFAGCILRVAILRPREPVWCHNESLQT